jgi:hypothetical protein
VEVEDIGLKGVVERHKELHLAIIYQSRESSSIYYTWLGDAKIVPNFLHPLLNVEDLSYHL